MKSHRQCEPWPSRDASKAGGQAHAPIGYYQGTQVAYFRYRYGAWTFIKGLSAKDIKTQGFETNGAGSGGASGDARRLLVITPRADIVGRGRGNTAGRLAASDAHHAKGVEARGGKDDVMGEAE